VTNGRKASWISRSVLGYEQMVEPPAAVAGQSAHPSWNLNRATGQGRHRFPNGDAHARAAWEELGAPFRWTYDGRPLKVA
jgi:hypothetical protein